MTFLELYGDLLYRELGSADRQHLFTVARRKAAINEAQREWNRLTESFSRELIFTLADGVAEYDLEARAETFWAVAKPGIEIAITSATGDVQTLAGDDLLRRDVVWLNREEAGWRDASAGTPSCSYLRDDGGRTLLGFSPAPDIGAGELWTVRVPYVAQPADLSADTDEPFSTSGNPSARLRPYHKALAHYAAADLVPVTRAGLDLHRARGAGAVEHLAAAVPYETGTVAVLVPLYLRGQAYLAQHEPGRAIEEFSKILAHRGAAPFSPACALAHLGIARAWREAGDAVKSDQADNTFLELWRSADPTVPIFKAARQEREGERGQVVP